jgi:hypothetical protein
MCKAHKWLFSKSIRASVDIARYGVPANTCNHFDGLQEIVELEGGFS